MIRLLTITLISLFATIAHAQIVEAPLTSNPVLELAAQQKAEEHKARLDAFQQRYAIETPSVFRSGSETQDPIYVLSGETIAVCNENYTALESSTVDINCAPLNFGTMSIQDTCFTYVANAGVDLGRDTICLAFCIGTDCDTFNYPIVVKRANTSTTPTTITLDVNDEAIFSFDDNVNALPGNFTSQEILDETICGEYTDNGTFVGITGFSGLYKSTSFGDTDEICIVVCDDATICDTVKYTFVVNPIITSLPFFDDFTNVGPYPDTNNWLDNRVFVNTTYGNQPPSVGVATFDGIDGSGTPYYMGDEVPSDILTSAYIDLSMTSETYLSFYIQPKGNGDKPETQDSLILQFRNSQDQWVQIDAFAGLANTVPFDSIPPFVRKAYTNSDFQFKHTGFQFRFINKSNGRGMGDNWNLDYVLLDAQDQGSSFEDVAFTQLPNDILAPYSSMPWDHFEGNAATELDQLIQAGIFNHSTEIANAGGSTVSLTETTTNSTVYNASLYNGIEANIEVATPQLDTYDLNSSDPVVFPNVWTGLDYLTTMQNDFNGSTALSFDLTYELQSTLNTVASNDVVTRTTIFDDYFAYDDGSAESNISAQGSGTQIAVQFHANKADTLKAIQLFIPRLSSNVSSQQFNLKVWIGSLDGEAAYTLAQTPIYADLFADTIQGYTTYRFKNPATGEDEFLPLPAGDFYVGWEQVTNEFTNAIPVGLDKNNETANEFLYGFVNGNWSNVTNIKGATMIRPVVGSANPFTTDVETLAKETAKPFQIYPNPSNGQFQINLLSGAYADFMVAIYSSTGQLIHQSNLSATLDLPNFDAGIYFAKIMNINNNEVYQERLVVLK